MPAITPSILSGFQVQLEPIHESHRTDLYTAAQDESIWTYNGSNGYGDRFHGWFDKALNALNNGQQLPYAVRRVTDHKIIGSTRFYDIYAEHKRFTIGYTWYTRDVWGTFVNPACKLLLLQHAFETLNFNRVEFVTDARNTRSQAAIKKLGAMDEGTLRQHMVLESGLIRDTVVYSIIKSDWPQVKSTLQQRLLQFS